MKIPPRYANAKYEDAPANVREKFELLGKNKKGLYIFGGVGTGKTHSLYALGQIQRRIPSMCVIGVVELLHKIKKQFGQQIHWEWEDDFLDYILNYNGILALDDLGAEKMSEWVEETFYLIVNKRYEQMRPTIFASNYRLEDMADRIGDRIASRIVEMCDVVEIGGEDKRLKIKI